MCPNDKALHPRPKARILAQENVHTKIFEVVSGQGDTPSLTFKLVVKAPILHQHELSNALTVIGFLTFIQTGRNMRIISPISGVFGVPAPVTFSSAVHYPTQRLLNENVVLIHSFHTI